MHMLLILLALCLRKPDGISHLFSITYTFVGNGCYEPQFSNHSHGFRPGRGCHTALKTVQETWTGTKWYIEGDIAQCFERIGHQVLLAILRGRCLKGVDARSKRPSEFVSIDEESQHKIVHVFCLRKTNCSPH